MIQSIRLLFNHQSCTKGETDRQTNRQTERASMTLMCLDSASPKEGKKSTVHLLGFSFLSFFFFNLLRREYHYWPLAWRVLNSLFFFFILNFIHLLYCIMYLVYFVTQFPVRFCPRRLSMFHTTTQAPHGSVQAQSSAHHTHTSMNIIYFVICNHLSSFLPKHQHLAQKFTFSEKDTRMHFETRIVFVEYGTFSLFSRYVGCMQ